MICGFLILKSVLKNQQDLAGGVASLHFLPEE